MSLFVCEKCNSIENTALCHFWLRGNGPGLCSACDLEIGTWHGIFDRREYDPEIDAPAWMNGEWLEARS